ncbi:kinase-like protein [Auricularia subglabra TFB-10046 SS5]|nr:kinase-like protein [Auricularia subglabra TFB-10046 SS5]
MAQFLNVVGTAGNFAQGLEGLGGLVGFIYTATRDISVHRQQCQKLAEFCGKVVTQLNGHVSDCLAMAPDAQRERHLERSNEYIAQMTKELEETKALVTKISKYNKFDALVKGFQIKHTIAERRAALTDCVSLFAITSNLGLLQWTASFSKAAEGDRSLLVQAVSATQNTQSLVEAQTTVSPAPRPVPNTDVNEIDSMMRMLQVHMRTFDHESAEYRNAEATLRDVQQKADMRLLPLADLMLEARKIDDAPVYYSATAEIWKGIWLNDPSTIVALKCLRAQIGTKEQREKVLTRFHRQVEIVRRIQHRNIIKLYGVCYVNTTYLVFPWMKNGDILAYLTKHPHADRMRLMLDVARGLAHLHAQDPPMVHSALQPSNVLVDDEHRAIVADFGLTKAIESLDQGTNYTLSNGAQVSMRWMAPELSEGKYGMPADVYAWGMTALQVISGLQPFYLMKQPGRVVIAVNRGERPKREQYADEMFTEESWKLLEDCWKQDPNERLKMNEVVRKIEEMRPDLVGA